VLSDAKLLIIEEQFLIALDIQRVVDDANARHTVFARNWLEAAALGDRLNDFDLAIVTPPGPNPIEQATAGRLVANGTAVVVCSAFRQNLHTTVLHGLETVDKPFRDEVLLAACLRALAGRQKR
jgi:hypothetical protein